MRSLKERPCLKKVVVPPSGQPNHLPMFLLMPPLHSWVAWDSEVPLPSSRHDREPGKVWKECGLCGRRPCVRPTQSSIQNQQHWDCRQSERMSRSQSQVACGQQITFKVTPLSTLNSSLQRQGASGPSPAAQGREPRPSLEASTGHQSFLRKNMAPAGQLPCPL